VPFRAKCLWANPETPVRIEAFVLDSSFTGAILDGKFSLLRGKFNSYYSMRNENLSRFNSPKNSQLVYEIALYLCFSGHRKKILVIGGNKFV